jgi:hypothetical protein
MTHLSVGARALLKLIATLLACAMATATSDDFRTQNLALLEASKSGNTESVITLLQDGASVNTRDRFGNGALIYAVRGKHLRTAMILLESGADVNQANVSGITSLYEAAGGGDIEIVRLLLHEGADPTQDIDCIVKRCVIFNVVDQLCATERKKGNGPCSKTV